MTALTLANQLTLLRMLLIPAFVILVVYGYLGWALIVFVTAGVTDALELMMLLFAITTLAVETALLDTFHHPAAAFVAVGVAVGTTLALTPFWSRSVVIAVGTIVGIVFASWLLARQLRRSPLIFVTHL